MRPFALTVLALFALPMLLAIAPPTSASGGAHVDAGVTQVVSAGQAFALEGVAEGFAGPTTATWTAPGDCSVQDASALVTLVACSAVGLHAFTVTATDGASTASATVTHSIILHTTSTLLSRDGSETVGTLGRVALTTYGFRVPAGTTRLDAVLTMDQMPVAALGDQDFDLQLVSPVGESRTASTVDNPERLVILDPLAGPWTARARAFLVANGHYHLEVTGTSAAGISSVPTQAPSGRSASVGDSLTLSLAPTGGLAPYAFRWETDPASHAFDDGTGSALAVTFAGPTIVRARIADARGLETETSFTLRERTLHPVTIVAVVDNAFSPYHFDFIASQHPWNKDADPATEFDGNEDPAAYIPGYPGATPLQLTLPTSASDVVSGSAAADGAVWDSMLASSASQAHVYRFPGTKIVAALHFGGGFVGTNDDHGSRSAASAAGNVHGTCPECLFVLIQDGARNEGLRWAASQPWIDVVTNSYGHGSLVQTGTLGLTRDNMYWNGPVQETRAASDEGQTIVFSAGNGLVNAFDVPMFTYDSSEKGPDWMVTVGAVDPDAKQTYSGAGKPVDVSSIGASYPSSGGSTANGEGFHSGTSNAAPTTAGYFGKVLQAARELLGDVTPGHAAGVVASGAPVACGAAKPDCPLGDGVLTRRELEDSIMRNVLPSTFAPTADTVWPSTQYNYYYQGHGVLVGRIDGNGPYDAQWQHIVATLHGGASDLPRPDGETTWFLVDSKCRQHLWGAWDHGLWNGQDLAPDAQSEPFAFEVDTWCSRVPAQPFPATPQV